jgi:hypothetical protein
MRALIVLAILVAVLFFGLRHFIAPLYGPDVRERFIEASKSIPSIKEKKLPGNDGAYNLSNFALWLAAPQNQSARRGYVSPVILPFDILFLIALGSLLGWASSLFAGQIGPVSTFNPLIWWILPLAFLTCDFVEDMFIVGILTWPDLLSPTSFRMLTSATAGKLWTLKVASLQTALLLAGWLLTIFATLFR